MIYHGGETAGYNSKMVVDTTNDVTLVLWTNLTRRRRQTEQQTANTLMLKVLDQIYVQSPLAAAASVRTPLPQQPPVDHSRTDPHFRRHSQGEPP